MKGGQIMYGRFVQLLQERDVTPYRVSKDTGVTQTTLSDWKTGRGTPKTSTLKKIADYFGVSLDWLMGQSRYRNKREMIKYAWIDYEFSDPNFDPAFDFAPFLKKVRESHGISTKEMADAVRGFTEDKYIKVENGELPLLIGNAYYFCKHLSTTIETILRHNNIQYTVLDYDAYNEKQQKLENINLSSEFCWIYDLQVMLKQAGYELVIKANNKESSFYIKLSEGILEVTENDLKSINNSINEFIRFKMFEIKHNK